MGRVARVGVGGRVPFGEDSAVRAFAAGAEVYCRGVGKFIGCLFQAEFVAVEGAVDAV